MLAPSDYIAEGIAGRGAGRKDKLVSISEIELRGEETRVGQDKAELRVKFERDNGEEGLENSQESDSHPEPPGKA